MSMRVEDICPRCAVGWLRAWRELTEDEQEVARRLPGSADYSIAERAARHRWCTHCWYEATNDVRHNA